MTTPAKLKPAPSEGREFVRGVLFGFFLQPVALIAIALIGSLIAPPDGALFVLPFIVLIGVTQWIYLAPFAWWLRGSKGMAKGILASGAVMSLVNALFWGGSQLRSLEDAETVRRSQEYQREHPTDLISADGEVTLVDDKHFEFRRDDDGTVVSLQTWEGLDYIFLKKDGGYEERTRDILKPGVRVAIDYFQERGKPPLSASIVRVYEEGARRD
jgi:hypothetical protein